MKGCDYSWDHPDLTCLKSKGVTFIVRYGSRDQSKNLTKTELDAALKAGLGVAVVWQEGKTQMLRGYPGGQKDAADADKFVKGLGLTGIPIYYSCDFDPGSLDWAAVDAYLEGTISVTGRDRNGGYGGYNFIKREFDRGNIRWGWQTYAWSGSPTKWDSRAQLRQVDNDVSVCSGKIDWDESTAADFGQWPRPGGGTAESESDMTPSVTYWYNKNNSKHEIYQAMRWKDGRVCYAGPDTKDVFKSVADNSYASSGVDIAVSDAGEVVIAYINRNGEVCHYRRPSGGGAWTHKVIGGEAL